MQFIDSARSMASSLSTLVNNISEGIHRRKCKVEHDDKKCETCELNISIVTDFLHIQTSKKI